MGEKTPRDRTRNSLLVLASFFVLLLLLGTLFYHVFEGFSLVDSFYFTATTMLKIGYGDIVPASSWGKIAAAFFSLAGVLLLLLFALALVRSRLNGQESVSKNKPGAGVV